MGAASVSLSPNGTSKPTKKLRRSVNLKTGPPPTQRHSGSNQSTAGTQSSAQDSRRESILLMDQLNMPNSSVLALARTGSNTADGYASSGASVTAPLTPGALAREAVRTEAAAAAQRALYDERLATAIWARATANANPAVDLLVCLERSQPIGFRYVDITRPVVIHHGGKDSRVPVENVRWLGRSMRSCEVRILDGEGHGLMASAAVMGRILGEMSAEWEDTPLPIAAMMSPGYPAPIDHFH